MKIEKISLKSSDNKIITLSKIEYSPIINAKPPGIEMQLNNNSINLCWDDAEKFIEILRSFMKA